MRFPSPAAGCRCLGKRRSGPPLPAGLSAAELCLPCAPGVSVPQSPALPAPCSPAPRLPSPALSRSPGRQRGRHVAPGAAPARPAPRCRRTGRARPCRRAGPALPRGGAGLGCPGAAPHGRTRSARQPGPGPVAHGERGPAAARQQEAAGRFPRRPRSPVARRGMPGPRMPAWGILPVTLPAFTITGMWIV